MIIEMDGMIYHTQVIWTVIQITVKKLPRYHEKLVWSYPSVQQKLIYENWFKS